MRKTVMPALMLMLATMLMLWGCKKDEPGNGQDNPGGETAASVVGTWNVDVNSSTMHEEESFDGETEIEDYTLREEGMVECRLVFHDNGKFEMTTVYEEDGERESYTDVYTYSVEGNTMVWDGEEKLTITHLDDKSLVLDEAGTTVYPEGTYSWTMHLVCERASTL